MTSPLLDRSPHNLANQTFRQVEAVLVDKPSLIVPVAGLEAVGEQLSLGATNRVCEAIAAGLARATDTLCAPLVALGVSGPFQAFGGAGGVRGRTLTNVLLESMESWRAQGFQRFFLVDGLSANTAAVDEAALRFAAQGRGSVRVLRWQADPEVRALVAKRLNATEPGRCEYGLLCLSAHVDPGLLHAPAGIVERASGSASDYASWRKRGRDPRRFRKLFPRAQVLAESVGPDAAFGATLFGVIVERFASIVAQASA